MNRIRGVRGGSRIAVCVVCVAVGALLAAPAAAATLEVEIEGVSGELERNVRSLLRIHELAEEGDVDPGRIHYLHERSPEEIALALQPFGFYRSHVDSSLHEEGGTWTARYEIDRGPPIRVSEISVEVTGEGADDPVFRQAATFFPLFEGDVLVHALYEDGKDALYAAAAEAGYLDAEFTTSEARVDLDRYLATIDLEFATGPRYLFGPVRFLQEELEPDLLRGYVTFEPGDPYDLTKLLKLQEALTDAPYFARVEVVGEREDAVDRRVPIDVHLVPAKPHKYTMGAGYGSDTGPRGRLRWEWRRVNQKGHRAEVEGQGSEIEQHFGMSYLIPGAYPRTDVLALVASYVDERPEPSRSESAYVGAKLTNSRRGWREGYALGYRRERFTVGRDSGVSELILPEASWSLVEADDRIVPSRGYRVSFELRGALEELASDTSFLQAVVGGKHVRAFARDYRVLSRLELGWIETSEFSRLPPTLRFFTGGDRSVRGYSYRSLGGLDADGNVVGGVALRVASLELERRILERWAAAVFVDAGNANDSFTDDWKRGAGVGGRWLSPIGPVRLDVAWGLDDPGRPLRLHFSVGPEL